MTIRQALKEAKMFTADEIAREIYESRVKAQRDEISLVEEKIREGIEIGERKGIEIGERKGKQEGVEIGERKGKQDTARKMLACGKFSIEEIAELTGLAPGDLERLGREGG